MDDEQLNKYIQNLPKPVQDVVFDGIWEQRTVEIGKKYSLTDIQIEDLSNIVILILVGVQKPEEFLDVVMSDLGISRLLAEQIVEELENRVFEYALKEVESKKVKSEEKTQTTTRVPEVKPDNLPAIEIGEVAHDYTPEKQKTSPVQTTEIVQKPYGVPRFGMSQIKPKVEVINMNQNRPATPQGMMESKMSNVTVNMGENFVKKESAEPPKMPTTKYTVDPYRESIG